MFTIEQTKAAHSKVKSGADFPGYIKELKTLGVISYEHFVADGQIQYHGEENFQISATPKWPEMEIAETGSIEKLKQALGIHQQGRTDYLTFCKQSAEAGVKKWIVDFKQMTCTYYDRSGDDMVVESVPEV
ncbi:DUF1398 domain-containing protein [Aquiflexum sp.]|uniref:DUF1398 domain-containing protein n=1 Tax=Aquiflexum sp. TaxID=1872584 RepID=UPI0035937717